MIKPHVHKPWEFTGWHSYRMDWKNTFAPYELVASYPALSNRGIVVLYRGVDARSLVSCELAVVADLRTSGIGVVSPKDLIPEYVY